MPDSLMASELFVTLGVWYRDPGWWSFAVAFSLGIYTWRSTKRARKEANAATKKQEQFELSQDLLNREFQATQNEIQRRFQSTRDRLDRIIRDRRAFLRSFNSFRSVPGVDDTGDATARVQDVGRFFRESVRHYSACRNVFEEMKSDLGENDRLRLEKMSEGVARYFTDNFDIEKVRELVRRQGEFLGAAKRVVDSRLEKLREELENAGGDSRDDGDIGGQQRNADY